VGGDAEGPNALRQGNDISPALVPPVAVTTTVSPAAATEVAVVLTVVQAAPASSSGLQLQPAVLVAPSLTAPVAKAALVATTLPVGNVPNAQPAPAIIGGIATSPAADEEAGQPINPMPVPAPEPGPAQPEQATRALPPPGTSWPDASAAYFTANAGSAEQPAGPMGEGPSDITLQAAMVVAGFVAVAGETRFRALQDAPEERKEHKPRLGE
jgi:hypothetical protein